MLLRQAPREDEMERLIIIDDELSEVLQQNGFYPLYLWENYFWYESTDELMEFLKKGCEVIGG